MRGVLALLAVLTVVALAPSASADGLLLDPAPWETKPTPRACILVGSPVINFLPAGGLAYVVWNQTYSWGPENITISISTDGNAANATWTLVWSWPIRLGENRIPISPPTGVTCPEFGESGAPGCILVARSSRGFQSCASFFFTPAAPEPLWNPPTGWSPQPWWNTPTSSNPPQPWWNSPSTNTPQPWWSSPSTNTPQPWWNSPSTNTPQPWWNSPSTTNAPQSWWNQQQQQPNRPRTANNLARSGICRPFPELNLDLAPVKSVWSSAREMSDSANMYSWTLDPCARSSNALLINHDSSPKLGGTVASSNDTAYFGGSQGQVLIRMMNFEMPYCMQAMHRPALLNFWLRCGDADFDVDSIDASHYHESCEVSVYITSAHACAVSGHAISKPAKAIDNVAEFGDKAVKPAPKYTKSKVF